MKNIPDKIYLQVEGEGKDDLNKLEGVTWSKERIDENDIAFVKEDEMAIRIKKAVNSAIPITWLDPLLTGEDAALPGGVQYNGNDIEMLLNAVKKRVKHYINVELMSY